MTIIFPDSPAARRMEQLLVLVKDASPAAIAMFIDETYTADFAAAKPLKDRITTIMEWHIRGVMEVISVSESSPNSVDILVEQGTSLERWWLSLAVEGNAPWRIVSLASERAPLPVTAPEGSDTEIAYKIVDYVNRLAEADLYSGCVLVARHGAILAQHAYGFANRDFDIPNTISTRFNVASLTKMWTAIAICQLIEAGDISLTDRLSKFQAFPDAETADRITVAHLLSHTSGLGDYFTDAFYARPRDTIRQIDDFLQVSSRAPLAFDPGTAWKYSNTGMVLLGRIIELISGHNYVDYLQKHIFDVAGMKDTFFPELDQVNPRIAVGYGRKWNESGLRIVNNLYDNAVKGCPAGCAYGTVSDIFCFAEAFNSSLLVSRDMAQQMTAAKPELGSPNYGFGFAVMPDRAIYGHSGGLLGASSNLDISKDPDGWVIVILANDIGMRAPTLRARQLIGVMVHEPEGSRAYLPNAGRRIR